MQPSLNQTLSQIGPAPAAGGSAWADSRKSTATKTTKTV